MLNKESRGVYLEQYLEWVQQANIPPITSLQHRFAEWLLQPENLNVISQLGELDKVFNSVRKYIKSK